MSAASLYDPVTDDGIANPNWFEGRLLTAATLRDKDKAERQRFRLLGRALGSGVFEGLFVTRGAADANGFFKTLNITKGAAINPDGDVLVLGRDITVDVVPPAAPATLAPALFEPCDGVRSPSSLPSGFGIYVLLMCPAATYRDRAPKSGLGTEGIVTGCGDSFAVEGVRFRTEKLEPTSISGISEQERTELRELIDAPDDAPSRSLLRNLVAHYCFGTPELAGFPADPFALSGGVSEWLRYGAIDDLRGIGRLRGCDVPITLFLWSPAGVTFLDAWSVRRAPTRQSTALEWPLVASDRMARESEARFLQFQAHLAELIGDTGTVSALFRARTHFRYLPAAGLLPVDARGRRGVTTAVFFDEISVRFPRPPRYGIEDAPEFLDGARLLALLKPAQSYPPCDLRALASNPRTGSTKTEAVWLYRVRENKRAIDAPSGTRPPELVVFASGQMPYFGSPRLDVAAWNYSNYSSSNTGPGGL